MSTLSTIYSSPNITPRHRHWLAAILAVCESTGGPASRHAIQAAAGTTARAANYVLKELHSAGLVKKTKKPGPTGRRVPHYVVTLGQ